MALAIIDDVKRYLDGCSCTRDTKGEMTLIRQQLEQKDAAIERLEDDIRRKDGEKDNLMKMQRDLQEQIAQISIALEAQAAESDVRAFDAIAAEARQVTAAGAQVLATASEVLAPAPAPVRPRAAPTEEERKAAAAKIEALARGRSHRMAIKRGDVDALADPDRAEKVSNIQKKKRASTRMQANFRGKHDRESLRRGEVPQRTPAEQAAVKARAEKRRAAELADAAARGVAPPPPEPADDEAYDDESVDSDYDVDDGAFANLGRELLSGPLKIAKVYGQDEPPAQEDELEWDSEEYTDVEAIILAELLKANTCVHRLDLARNQIGDPGAVALANMLASNSSLEYLNLESNMFGERGGTAFLDVLQRNSSINYLNLISNSMSSSVQDEMRSAWQASSRSVGLHL